MSIVFYCHSCGTRFNIDPRMAGKQGRCKKCGKQMTVPTAEEIASKAARPAPVAVGAMAGGGKGSATSWLGDVDAGDVALAPLTIDRAPRLKKTSIFAEDDLADSKPYLLAEPERRSGGGRVVAPVSGVMSFWRRQLGKIERIFRWINQTAYLVSVPFVMLLMLGIMVRSHPMANFGAAMVVALNITRLVSGFFNLTVIPFRDGINWKRLKKPLRRVIEPAATIGVVALAFAFVPWLSYKHGRLDAALQKFERSLDDSQSKARAVGSASSSNQP